MGEGARPSSFPDTQTAEQTRTSFNPLHMLNKTIQYGEWIWRYIESIRGTGVLLSPIINISLVIEDQIQNLIALQAYSKYSKTTIPQSSTVADILSFYSLPEIHPRQTKYHPFSLSRQLHCTTQKKPKTDSINYYNYLTQLHEDPMTSNEMPASLTTPNTSNEPKTTPNKSFFVEDLAVNEISDIVRNRMDLDRQQIENGQDTESAIVVPATQNLSLDIPVAQRIRINLIRHRYARATEMTTLKLFQSFITILRKVDKNVSILPYDSKKQQYTSIVSHKQIEQLNEHQLKLYFQSWHREQFYSLSGFIHLSSLYSFEEIFNQDPVIEWLDTYQYSVKRCSSQSEEMAIVGALCYGSTWIYREDLKLHIMQHPEWTKINNNDDPIIFDLLLRTFRGQKKNTTMIFVSAERSKQEVVRDIFKRIYDGTAKEYPRGEMLFFIPTRNGEQYTPEQREKFIFNHDTYLGDEEVTAIHGLKNLNTEVKLPGGKVTLLRTLLKSLPATEGMSRNKLFQVVDPNAGQTCTIVTFQKSDRHFIEQRKATLERELRAILGPEDIEKIFIDPNDGIWFGGNVRTKNGKPVTVNVPNKSDIEYIKNADAILNNPPKKRNITNNNTNHAKTPPNPPTQISYREIVQAHHTQTQSVSIQDTEGTTTTTTTQTSQMVTATVEARFQVIETEMRNQKHHQMGMDRRLFQVEQRTTTIDENIAAMMEHWKINPQKRKAAHALPDNNQRLTGPGEDNQTMDDEGNVSHPHDASLDMEMGDMEGCL
jgi:hypothetical protein